jgi:hypothetical protein
MVYVLYLLSSLVMSLQSAGAQMLSGQSVVTDIPFAFIAKGELLPSARYAIEPLGGLGSTLVLRSSDGRHTIFLNANRAQGAVADRSRLQFRCYGKTCFLEQVFRQGEAMGYELPRSAQEREVAQKLEPRLVVMMLSPR